MGRLPAPRVARAPRPAWIQTLASQEDATTYGVAFFMAAAVILVRMSVLPEMVAYLTGTNTYLLYLFAPPALLGVLLTGGLGRVFRAKAAWCWTGLFFWMLVAAPFSSWRGDSAQHFIGYAKANYICLLALAGTVTSWKQIKIFLKVMGLAGVMVLAVSTFMATPDPEGRLRLDVRNSSIGNANDLAAHVLLLMPFLTYFAIRQGRNMVVRLIGFGLTFYSIWIILDTSSRGAFVGLAAMALLLFSKATGSQRIAVMVIVPVLVVTLMGVLPAKNRARLATIFATDNDVSSEVAAEAGESRDARKYAFTKSIEFTLKHPIFGVGAGQFANFEGSTSRQQGQHGRWLETHNAYTQMSSECGIPGLLLMLGGMVGAFKMVNQTFKKAKAQGNKEVADACLCYMVSWLGYLVTLFFLAGAYFFTLPAMISLAIAMYYAAERELARTAPVSAGNFVDGGYGSIQTVRAAGNRFHPA